MEIKEEAESWLDIPSSKLGNAFIVWLCE